MVERSAAARLLVLSAEEVSHLLSPLPVVSALEQALAAYSDGKASVPPRTAAFSADGLLGAMPAFVEGVGLGMKAVSLFSGNHDRGLPSHQALILLFDEPTGAPLSLLDGTHITAMRTAGASALSVKLLARSDAAVLTIVGTGVQAGSHLLLLSEVCRLAEIRIWGRDPAAAANLAARHPKAVAHARLEEAVAGSDILALCTHASTPPVPADLLQPGMHVVSVGSERELDLAGLDEARLFVEWRGAAEHEPPAGAAELQGLSPASVTELGEVLLGRKPGRQTEDDLTIYKSTGLAVEDLAAARLVYDAAVSMGLGTWVKL